MFRSQKPRPTKSGEKIDFRFSNFKAVQVPKGWDRLFMSVISIENGKTIGKTGRAVVRNGSCQWTETLSESIWVSRNEASKGMEDCVFRLVVAMVMYLDCGSIDNGLRLWEELSSSILTKHTSRKGQRALTVITPRTQISLTTEGCRDTEWFNKKKITIFFSSDFAGKTCSSAYCITWNMCN